MPLVTYRRRLVRTEERGAQKEQLEQGLGMKYEAAGRRSCMFRAGGGGARARPSGIDPVEP